MTFRLITLHQDPQAIPFPFKEGSGVVDPQVGAAAHHPLPPLGRGGEWSSWREEIRVQPAKHGRNEEDAKKMLNFTSEARKSLKTKGSFKKRTQNELVFARKNRRNELDQWPRNTFCAATIHHPLPLLGEEGRHGSWKGGDSSAAGKNGR